MGYVIFVFFDVAVHFQFVVFKTVRLVQRLSFLDLEHFVVQVGVNDGRTLAVIGDEFDQFPQLNPDVFQIQQSGFLPERRRLYGANQFQLVPDLGYGCSLRSFSNSCSSRERINIKYVNGSITVSGLVMPPAHMSVQILSTLLRISPVSIARPAFY